MSQKIILFLTQFLIGASVLFIPSLIDEFVVSNLKFLFKGIFYFFYINIFLISLGSEFFRKTRYYISTTSSFEKLLDAYVLGQAFAVIIFLISMFFGLSHMRDVSVPFIVLSSLYIGVRGSQRSFRHNIFSLFSERKYLLNIEKLLFVVLIIYLFFSTASIPFFSNLEFAYEYIGGSSLEELRTILSYFRALFHFFGGTAAEGFKDFYIYLYMTFFSFLLSNIYLLNKFLFSRKLGIFSCILTLSCWNNYLVYLEQGIFVLFLGSLFLSHVLYGYRLYLYRHNYWGLCFISGALGLFSNFTYAKLFLPITLILWIVCFLLKSKNLKKEFRLFFWNIFFAGQFILVLTFNFTFLELDSTAFFQNLYRDLFFVLEKSIFVLAPLVVIYFIYYFIRYLVKNKKLTDHFKIIMFIFLIFSLSSVWFLVNDIFPYPLFCVFTTLTTAFIHQVLIRLSSQRRSEIAVFGIYLICALLDSRLEERVKDFLENLH